MRASCDGQLVADHDRTWARHQTITDPEHLAAARALRRDRLEVIRPAAEPGRRSPAGWPTTTPPSDRRGGVMAAAKTASRDVTAELAFLTRALKAPDTARVGAPAGRAGPRRVVDP